MYELTLVSLVIVTESKFSLNVCVILITVPMVEYK